MKRLKRVYGYIFVVAYKWNKKTGALGLVNINKTKNKSKRGVPSGKCTKA
jgi:hypothetical protein